jgi:DNA-binding HxlR family transcriptional regulator
MSEQTHCAHRCPIETTLDVLGGKWKGMVLHRLLYGTMRFGELKRMIPRVTQRMLTRQLRELERDGVIRRKVYPEVPPKVEYSLTTVGLSLKPILLMMSDWGEQYQDQLTTRKVGQPHRHVARGRRVASSLPAGFSREALPARPRGQA